MSTNYRGWYVAAMAAAFTTLFINSASAQHENHTTPVAPVTAVEVSGFAVCSDGPQLPGAVVQAVKTGARAEVVASALSDESGRFRLRLPAGAYSLRISYLGHSTSAKPLVVEGGVRQVSLGNIPLEIRAVEIDALVAVAEKERLRMQAGAVTYDTKRSALAATGTVAEMVRDIPGLEIDGAGNLTLRGDKGVLVLLNGRRTSLSGDALTAFLKQMPASSLEKVEVNTTPSAQHDANGVAGIVNFQFKSSDAEPRTDAYGLSASAASARQYVGSASYKGSRGALRWDGLYSFSSLRPHTSSETTRQNFFAGSSPVLSWQSSHADARHLLHNILATAALRVDKGNEIELRGGYSWMRGAFDNGTSFGGEPNSPSALTYSTLEHTMPNADLSAGWTFRSSGARHVRTNLELRYADAAQDFNGRYVDGARVEFLRTDMDLRRKEYTVRSDIAFDLTGTRFDLGYQTRIRRIDADYDVQRTGSSSMEAFGHEEDVHALYGSAARVLSSVFVTAGLRAEVASTRLDLDGAVMRHPSALQLFPSLSVHWPHESTGETEYQLAYARRINRPDASSLNPYSMGEDDMNSFIGNPLLEPELADQLEFSMVRHGVTTTLRAAPYVRYVANPVRAIKAITESGRATTSLQNLRDAASTGIDVSVRARLHDGITTLVSSNVYYGKTRGSGVDAEGVYASFRGSVDMAVARNTTVQLYAFRRSAQEIEQGSIAGAWNSDVAVMHRFGAEQRGTLTLTLSDPFNSDGLTFRIGDQSFSQRSARKITSRMLALGLAWGLGGESKPEGERGPEKAPQIF